MTTSIISSLQDHYPVTQINQEQRYPYCTLKWRRGQLLVKPLEQNQYSYLPSLNSQQALIECLKHSPVNLVRIDPKLGEANLKLWADACEQASKPIYLRIPTDGKAPKLGGLLLGWLKRLTDWFIALLFLLAVIPVMLGLVVLMRLYSTGSILEKEWHVGERGKLFRMFKFRTSTAEQSIAHLGHWMRKYGLHNLPLLLNVLRGEMSLTGPRCWTLKEAVRLNPEGQQQLNKLPGITGSWQVDTQSSSQLFFDSANSYEL